jgi:hypothetical protein
VSALGQGGPGLPPEIMQAIAGLPGGPGGAGAGAPAPQAPSTKSDGDWEQDLQQAIAALRELEGDATDHQEASVIATCIAQLRKLTAARQSGAESALGVTPANKAMSRAGY